MTRHLMPVAVCLGFAIWSVPASAASTDDLSLESTPEAREVTDLQAERKGSGNKSKKSSSNSGKRSGEGAHHAAPSRGNQQARGSSGGPGGNESARGSGPRGGDARGESNGRATGPDRGGNADRGGANSGKQPGSRESKARSGNSGRSGSDVHRRPDGAASDRHKSNEAHKRVTKHKREAAHKSANAHRSAASRAHAARRSLARSRSFWNFHPHTGHRSRVFWYHGVFVYGPHPRHHHHHNSVVVSSGSSKASSDLPSRQIDRNGDFAIGLRTGSYMNAYDNGGAYSDFGLGAAARWRPVESLGIEMAYTYYSDTWDDNTERETGTIQPSVQLYAFPWSRMSPYVTAGVTWSNRNYEDSYTSGFEQHRVDVEHTAFGPHAGLGLELAFGQSVALDLEGKYVGYMNVGGSDAGSPTAFQGTAGLNVYF